jgi:DNA polymerase-3 subunit alpha
MDQKNQNLILCFDTETTGLFRPKKTDTVGAGQDPFILQISWCIYDRCERAIIKMVDTYIHVEDTVPITAEITAINGATREKCDGGILITDALKMFYNDFIQCGFIVAHNLEYDKQMLLLEWGRHKEELAAFPIDLLFSVGWLTANNIKLKCTQRIGTPLCKLVVPNRGGYKFPKLVELYEFLFREIPENLHNSMIDILVCLRCFLKMSYQYNIENDVFHKIIEYYMKSSGSTKRDVLLNTKIGVEKSPVLSLPFPKIYPESFLETDKPLPLLFDEDTSLIYEDNGFYTISICD